MRLQTSRIFSLPFLILFFVQAIALSSPGQVNRKEFFGKLASSTLIIGTTLENNVGPAVAAETENPQKLYEPAVNSQKGKVHLITGASTGLGLESAKRIAAAGATIILTSRTAAKGERAVNQVQDYLSSKSIKNSEIYYLTLDLDNLESVKSFPERYNLLTSNKPIDVLMNNAGIAAIPEREITKDGFERTFQSNHLGPFVLTAGLFPYLNHNGARIINVSSSAHTYVKDKDFLNNLNSEKNYEGRGWGAYGQSKLENILFTEELQRRADAAGLNWLTVTSLHPGVVGTDIWRNVPLVAKTSVLTSALFYNRMLTTEEGANTQIYLATENEQAIAKGQYYDENGNVHEATSLARDPAKASELWRATERMSGVEFKLV